MVILGFGDETVYDLRLVMVPEAGLNDNKKTKDNKTSSRNHKNPGGGLLFSRDKKDKTARRIRISLSCPFPNLPNSSPVETDLGWKL